jgi:hypothetical protein
VPYARHGENRFRDWRRRRPLSGNIASRVRQCTLEVDGLQGSADPNITIVSGTDRVKLRSQVRFRMAPESAGIAREYLTSGQAQVLWDHDEDFVISWPSNHESMFVVEIVNVGATSKFAGLEAAHKASVNGFAFVFEASHGLAEIVAQSDLEDSPPRDLWVRSSGV